MVKKKSSNKNNSKLNRNLIIGIIILVVLFLLAVNFGSYSKEEGLAVINPFIGILNLLSQEDIDPYLDTPHFDDVSPNTCEVDCQNEYSSCIGNDLSNYDECNNQRTTCRANCPSDPNTLAQAPGRGSNEIPNILGD